MCKYMRNNSFEMIWGHGQLVAGELVSSATHWPSSKLT